MTAVELLSRVRNGRADIRRMEAQLERREAIAEDIGRSAENEAVIEGMRSALDDRRALLKAEILASCSLLEGLKELDADVLYVYYIEPDGNLDVYAKANGYSERYVRNVKRFAERLLNDVVSEDEILALLPEGYE